MNNSTFFGYLVSDPKASNKGDQKAFFTIAVKEWIGREVTTFIGCAVSGKRADTVVKYLKKGSGVVVSGRVWAGVYQGKGQLNITVKDLTFAGGGKKQETQPSQYPTPANQQPDYGQSRQQDPYQQQDYTESYDTPFFQ